MPRGTLFTIGHSTREADAFVALLRHHGVDLLVDVRRYPGSRRHPHFNREALAGGLAAIGIGYRHAPELGGRRVGPTADSPAGSPSRGDSSGRSVPPNRGPSPSPDDSHVHDASPNRGWRNASFRAYADYMATPPFRAALERLVEEAARYTVAIMCAEAVPWRCHRNLISDALVARDMVVRHILSEHAPAAHELNPMARLGPDGDVTYPGDGANGRQGRRGGGSGTGGGGGTGGGRGRGGEDGSQRELFD